MGLLRFSLRLLRRRRDGRAVGMRSSLTANPAPTPRPHAGVWDGGHTGTVSGWVARDTRLDSGHPTMKSENRLAKSVDAKYPFRGVENRPMW